MSKESRFMLKYRARIYGYSYLIGIVIVLILDVLFNLHDWLHGDFNPAFFGSFTVTIFIASYVMLLITPGRYFKTANILGISRKTLFKTDFWTPLLVSLLEMLLIMATSGIHTNTNAWWEIIGVFAFLTVGSNYFCQMIGDAIALVHGKWKFVVMIAIPVAFIFILVWALMGLSTLLDNMTFTKANEAMLTSIFTNGWLWFGALVLWVAIMTGINWLLVKHFHLMRD